MTDQFFSNCFVSTLESSVTESLVCFEIAQIDFILAQIPPPFDTITLKITLDNYAEISEWNQRTLINRGLNLKMKKIRYKCCPLMGHY